MNFKNSMKYLILPLILFSHYGVLISQDFQWDEPVKLSNNPKGWCLSPTICSDSEGNLYVAFRHYNLKERPKLYFTYFDGENWQGIDTLFQNLDSEVYDSKILCDNENTLHLTAIIRFGQISRLYYMKREIDSWSDPVQISVDSLYGARHSDMVVDKSGKIHFIYNIYDIYYRTYDDSVLSDPINLTNLDLDQYSAFSTKIDIDHEDNIHLTYYIIVDSSDVTDIHYQKFDGSVWSNPVVISEIDDLSVWHQDMTVDSEKNPHVVWEQQLTKLDTVFGNPTIVSYKEIFYATCNDNIWTTPINISNIPKSSSYHPKIAMYYGQPLVFFQTFYENGDDQQKHYSYKLNNEWHIKQWEVDFNTTKFFDYFVNSSDDLQIATVSAPITQRGEVLYIRGSENSTIIKHTIQKSPNSFNLTLYPNPFNNSTKIQFYLDKPDKIELYIYDINGRLVRTILSNQQLNSGLHSYSWDSTNNQNNSISSGIYFLLVSHGDKISYSKKMILLK